MLNKEQHPQLVAFGARLKEARTKRGWNQTAVAFYINKAQGEISEYETGTVQPGILTLRELCIVLGCSADYLLGLDTPAPQ